MTRLKLFLLTISLILVSSIAHAQGKTAFGETMRSNGRIYVVIGVLVIIFAGIIIYLVRLERKMNRMEKQFDQSASVK